MLTPVRSGQFRRDVKRAEARKGHVGAQVLLLLLNGETLPERYRDHPLRGNWTGYRDLHIEPDWLLIYRISGNKLDLVRRGSHSDLFDD